MGKKKYSLNLNIYRNTHHQTLNKAKVQFEQEVMPSLMSLPRFKRLSLTYRLFPGSRNLLDTSNVCSVVDKFFSDALQSAGKIPDDNHQIIIDINYRYGSVDPQNPRMEVSIHDYEIEEPVKEEPMRIILVQAEIEEAIKAYVLTQIQVQDGQEVTIDFKNTRGEDGATAEINIAKAAGAAPATPAAPQTPAKAPTTTRAPRTEKPAPAAPVVEPEAEKEQSIGEEAEVQPDPEHPDNQEIDGNAQGEGGEDVTLNLNEQAAQAAAAPQPGPKSLFAGLTKPVNPKPTAE